jgi:seryl-tRNA synthetase
MERIYELRDERKKAQDRLEEYTAEMIAKEIQLKKSKARDREMTLFEARNTELNHSIQLINDKIDNLTDMLALWATGQSWTSTNQVPAVTAEDPTRIIETNPIEFDMQERDGETPIRSRGSWKGYLSFEIDQL